MTGERWKEVRTVLESALCLDSEGRRAYLNQACASDSSLRREVESLLAADEQARTSFLQSPPLMTRLQKGTRLADYEIQSLLGAGGMGEVYRARDLRLRRDVAIKVLPAFVFSNPDRLRRFEQEATAAAALNHPNILAVHQLGTYTGTTYLVSELLEGETLRQQILGGRFVPRRVIDYGMQIAHGLAAAHEKGIVHRDLKPENLFVTKDGRIKILDFGLAKLTQPQPGSEHSALTLGSETEPGLVMGTVGYMAPEQVRGQTADHRADIFSFGAILYEMLTAKRAFQKPTSPETMSAILNEDPPGISQLAPSVPLALQRIVHRCLERNPEQRFQSASDLGFALEALLESGNLPSRAVEVHARSRLAWGLIAAVIAIVLAGGVAARWRVLPSVPVVEGVMQLTDDREPKDNLETDGARVFFNEGVPGNFTIAQASVSGGQTAQFTTKIANPRVAGLEADGSHLIALSGGPNDLVHPLWSMPLPAGEPRRLGDMEVTYADLFPDGRIIYALGSVLPGGATSLNVAERDGSNPSKLLEVSHKSIYQTHVSADGRKINFSSADADNSEAIYEIAADGTDLHESVKAGQGGLPSHICCGKWTPDGRYLTFQAQPDGGRWDLWALPENKEFFGHTRGPVRLTNGPLSYERPAPSRDGKRIFAIGSQRRGALVRYDPNLREFVPYLGGISALAPNFSNDGKWVAYASYPDHTLWRSRSDGSERLQLTYPPTVVSYPRISPDGSKVSFNTPNGDGYIIGSGGGVPRKVAERAYGLTWAPDGKLMMFTSILPGTDAAESDSWELRTLDLRIGSITVVPDSHGKLGGFFVNQDTIVAAAENTTKFLLYDF